MSRENATQNLIEFGKELNLEGLVFDENNTCILGIDNTFSLHLTYEPNSDKIYLYAPILDGLPKEEDIRLRLYEGYLEGSMLGGQMAGGGIGVATPEELVLLHATVDMGVSADSKVLVRFVPIFVETVEKWRAWSEGTKSGKVMPKDFFGAKTPPQGGRVGGMAPPPPPQQNKKPDSKGGGSSDRFIKI